MSASTVVANSASTDLTSRNLTRQSRKRSLSPNFPFGIFLLDSGAITLATTSIDDVNDRVRIFRCIPNTWAIGYSITYTGALDSNATPTLAQALETDDEAASPTRVNIATSITTGQAGGTSAAFFTGPVSLDSLTLNLKTTTVSATPVSGTVQLKLFVYQDNASVSKNTFA